LSWSNKDGTVPGSPRFSETTLVKAPGTGLKKVGVAMKIILIFSISATALACAAAEDRIVVSMDRRFCAVHYFDAQENLVQTFVQSNKLPPITEWVMLRKLNLPESPISDFFEKEIREKSLTEFDGDSTIACRKKDEFGLTVFVWCKIRKIFLVIFYRPSSTLIKVP
jgi:hypothetical protein